MFEGLVTGSDFLTQTSAASPEWMLHAFAAPTSGHRAETGTRELFATTLLAGSGGTDGGHQPSPGVKLLIPHPA